jgi:hypothetical protein
VRRHRHTYNILAKMEASNFTRVLQTAVVSGLTTGGANGNPEAQLIFPLVLSHVSSTPVSSLCSGDLADV